MLKVYSCRDKYKLNASQLNEQHTVSSGLKYRWFRALIHDTETMTGTRRS